MKISDFNIQRSSLPEVIAGKLEEMILADKTKLSDKLPSEQALATSFGVSRPVIREALVILRTGGLIEAKNGEGSFICEPGTENLTKTINRIVLLNRISPADVFSVRIMLELKAVELASANADSADITELYEIYGEMLSKKLTAIKRAELDVKFHARIAAASRNPLLCMMVNSMAALLLENIHTSVNFLGSGEYGTEEHEKIIELIKEHNTEVVIEAMRRHLISSERNFEAAVKGNTDYEK